MIYKFITYFLCIFVNFVPIRLFLIYFILPFDIIKNRLDRRQMHTKTSVAFIYMFVTLKKQLHSEMSNSKWFRPFGNNKPIKGLDRENIYSVRFSTLYIN